MKKKIIKAVFITLAGLALIWCGMFCTDMYRSAHLMTPVFAYPVTADNSGTYKGLGYTVEVETYKDDEHGVRISQVTMYVSDKAVSASIT